ncbi:acyl-CoA dehydrogenase family protein [Aquabacterium sp.]|uniref:acyl-CoA dehydrogenase family protein n=1 Tax=Aquabacterium sp. TaxID=1872578 RepID=UPI002BBA2940|nr:acyl-CoA dehydrogenase family protein [Aquabacterium sp.]HSW07041.1 acyl-CoA dehydrogenase family protein [Aquabacterium sp.]
MQFTLSDEQSLLHSSAQRYLAQAYRHEGGFSARQWQAFAEMGWLGLSLPGDVGGLDGSPEDLALLHQALGHALVREPVAAVAVLAGHLLSHAGQGAQALLPALVAGTARYAVALPGSRLLHGAAGADALIVLVNADGHDGQGEQGIAMPALHCVRLPATARELTLVDGSLACMIDGALQPAAADTLLCRGDAALHAMDIAQAWALVAASAESLGVMERALDATREHLLQRQQFGVAIASFQALRHRLADMVIAVEQARGALHAALAALRDADRPRRRRTLALAKMRVDTSGRFVGAQAIQLHGGMGMTDECIVGHCFKRLMVLAQ